MLTKDIAVRATTFRREGFRKFTEVSMSRRYIKNALFLVLFACLTIAIYTVVLNAKAGAKRAGLDDFVQNMVVEVPNHDKDDSYKHFDGNLDGLNGNLEDNGRNLEENLRPAHDPDRIPAMWPEVKEDENEAEVHRDNQNDNGGIPIWPEDKEDENQNDDNEPWGSQGGLFNNDKDELPLNNKADSNDDEDNDDSVEANNEEGGHAKVNHLDPEKVKVRDAQGNLVGYKLFPYGIHPDMDKSEEEREEALRKKLNLPPKEIKEPAEKVPERAHERREPVNVLPRPREEMIDAGGDDEEPDEPRKAIDDLGAFNLKDRVPNKVDAFLRPDKFNDKVDDELANGRMEDYPDDKINMDDYPLDDKFAGGKNPHLPRLNDRVQPANRDQIFPPRDRLDARNEPYPGRFAPRNDREDYAKRVDNSNRQRNANIGNIIRPIGNNGMNPYHLGEVKGRQDIMPDRMPESAGMAPFANNQGMPGNQIQRAPMGNNRMAPYYAKEGAVPNDRRMDPLGQQNRVLRPDSFQNAPVNNRGMDGFGRNPERMNNPVQADSRGRNPFAHRDEGIGEDLLDIARNEEMHPFEPNALGNRGDKERNPFAPKALGNSEDEERNPFIPNALGNREDEERNAFAPNALGNREDEEGNPFAPKAFGNREDAMLPERLGNGIKAELESAQGGADGQINSNDDEKQQIRENHSSHNASEGKAPVVQDQMPVAEKDEPQTPLVIKDIKKPLPVTVDCIPFLFPPKQGKLCVHDPVHDKALSGVIKTKGIWEPAMLSGFFAILRAHPDLNVVDIGAGIGVYSLTAALMDRKVIAVEPLYLNYRMLHKSALENHVSDKITLVAQAIGSESYLGHLNYSDEAGGYSQVRVDKVADDQTDTHSPDIVQVTTLNNLAQALPFKKAVLKIDVGGFMEAEVLTSSSKFFEALQVPYILTHWNFDTGVMKKIQIASLLSQKGYHPRTEWNGLEAEPGALQEDFDYLIWAL